MISHLGSELLFFHGHLIVLPMVFMIATHSEDSTLRVYSRIQARSPRVDGRSLALVGGLSSGRQLSCVDPRRVGADYGSEEYGVKRDVGRLSGPWYGRLGRLSLEHESSEVERRTWWSSSSSHLILVHTRAKTSSIVEQLKLVKSL